MNSTSAIILLEIDTTKIVQQESSIRLNRYVRDLHVTRTSLDFRFYLSMKCSQDMQAIIA